MPDPHTPSPPPGFAQKDQHTDRAQRVESTTTTYYDAQHKVLQQDVELTFITE